MSGSIDIGNIGLISKASSEASSGYEPPKSAIAATVSGNDAPTVGKAIPIITGGARPSGEVIWCQTSRDSNNACRGHIAICFGRNAFGRPIELRALAKDGVDIYLRKDGVSLDPPGAVRFYDGTQTAADPLIVSVEGAANTPAWTGYIYAVLENVVLQEGSNSNEYHAEFTDAGTVGSTTYSFSCDPDLDGIELVYDDSSGLYYGLEFPMSGASNILVSADGCNIVNRVPVESPYLDKYTPEGAGDLQFFAEKIVPVRCSGLVAITGFTQFPPLTPGSGNWDGKSFTVIFNPETGRMIHTTNLYSGGDSFFYEPDTYGRYTLSNYMQKNSLYSASNPSSSDVDWKITYQLPGEGQVYALLRQYDPADCVATDPGNYVAPITANSGNFAIQIFDAQTGRRPFGLDEMFSRTNNTNAGGLLYQPAQFWSFVGAPTVGEFNGVTSTTSRSIGTGSKSFTTNLSVSDTPLSVGDRIRVESASSASSFMEGIVTAWTGTALTVNVTRTNGSGTYASWNISLAGSGAYLLCRSGTESVTLAGVQHGTEEFTVYIWTHSRSGVTMVSTTNVTLPTDWGSSGIQYEPSTELVVVTARPNDDTSLVAPRLYKITEGGSSSYVEMSDGFNRVVGSPNGVSADGKVPVTNADFSKIGAMDIATGTIDTLYNDTAPDSTPVVDLNRNTISLPTISGRTSFAVSQVTADDIALSDLITDICALKGYSSGDLVFEGFSGLVVRGMTISTTTRVADLLNKIGQLYGFVFTETDGKLKFRRRRSSGGSATPDVTLTEDDLVENDELLTVQRQSATTVLGSLSLSWLDPDRDYETNNVMARRMAGVLSGVAGTRDEELSLPLAIAPATARQLLFEAFFAMAEAETRASFSVGPENLRIEPGDLISVTAGGATRLVQARRVTHRADLNTLDIEADTFMAQATTTIGGAGGNTTPPPTGAISGSYMHLDIPLVLASDYPGTGLVRQYHGLTTFDAETWGGADFYTSSNGTSFTKNFDYDVPPMAVAIAQNTLGDTPQTYALDETDELIIKVVGGNPDDFATVTYAEMMSDVTLCAYGRPGFWELIAFQTVTDNLDGTLSLTNLQRGLYGSNHLYFADDYGYVHQAGDYVCLLGSSQRRSTVRATNEIGNRDRYAVVTADVGLASAAKPWNVMPGTSMFPAGVANVIAEHTAGSNDLVLTWDAQSPIPHTWEDDGAEGIMPETYTYNITISTQSYGDFTFSTTDTTYTWTAYGATVGATTKAWVAITNVLIEMRSPVIGDGWFPWTYAREIREA